MTNWFGSISGKFLLQAGVRQGGVLSPVLFTVYIDSLIVALQSRGLGCQIGFMCFGILMYADDLILISSSVTEMQKMINVCTDELDKLDLSINIKKSVCIRVGRGVKNVCSELTVGAVTIPWASNMTYLGITIKSSVKFLIDLKICRTKFYRSFNSVFCRICKANELLIVSIVKTFCVPTVMYSVEALDLNASQLNSLDFLMFQAFGKIFKTTDRDTLNWCMYYMNTWPLRFEYYYRKIKFLTKIAKSENNLIISCFHLFGKLELTNLCRKVNVNNMAEAKNVIWANFASSIM